MKTTSAPAVEVHDLSKRFGSFLAVDRVSFEVAPGEVFGFLGPNGAGKTTTIKMLNGLLAPTSGSGRVAGFDISSERPAIKSAIGYMSQLFSLYGDLTVEENIEFFAGLYGVSGSRLAARRDWVMAMAGLEGERHRLTSELALGWKQRLALGCAVLHEPPILFLDEPTSGVDPISRRRFWDLIYDLASGGTTIFVTTHYMEEAESCHRLALMNRGRLVALDSPANLRAASRETLLELVTNDASGTSRAVEAMAALEGAPGLLRAGLFGRDLHLTVADREAAMAALPARLASHGIPVSSLREIPPSLEDAFISLVQATGGALEE